MLYFSKQFSKSQKIVIRSIFHFENEVILHASELIQKYRFNLFDDYDQSIPFNLTKFVLSTFPFFFGVFIYSNFQSILIGVFYLEHLIFSTNNTIQSCEVSCAFFKQFWKYYTNFSSHFMLHILIYYFKIQNIYAMVYKQNKLPIRLLDSIGFKCKELLQHETKRSGISTDIVVYSFSRT